MNKQPYASWINKQMVQSTDTKGVNWQIEILEQAIKICNDYSKDKYSLCKGRDPYTGKEEGRANDIVQGQSIGAEECADLLIELLEQVKLQHIK